MSFYIQGIISKRKIGGQTRRLLLVTMADKANDDGSGVYASVATLARDSEISESSTRRTIKEFLDEGVITLVGKRACTNGYTNDYTLNVSAIEGMPLLKPLKGSKPDTPVTVTPLSKRNPSKSDTPSSVEPVSGRHPTPVTVTPKPTLEPTLELTSFVLSSDVAGKAKPKKPKPAAGGYSPEFEAFWLSWPAVRRKRSNKPMAFARWKDARTRWEAETIMAAAGGYLSDADVRKEGFRFCRLAEVFLNGGLEAAIEAVSDHGSPAAWTEKDMVWTNGRYCWPDGKPVEPKPAARA